MKINFKQLRQAENYSRLGNIASELHLKFAANYRPVRMRQMQEYFGITSETTILDMGGSQLNWDYLEIKPNVTIMNIEQRPDTLPDNFKHIDGDVRDTGLASNSFDLCFSNSVIEHVGDWEDQQRMAEEIRRVGRSYYVQTPNYHFFIEPHFIAPFIHWFPKSIRRRLARYFSLWGLTTRPTQAEIDRLIDETILLRRRQMQVLFPDAQFIPEKSFGMHKSLIAVYREGESVRLNL